MRMVSQLLYVFLILTLITIWCEPQMDAFAQQEQVQQKDVLSNPLMVQEESGDFTYSPKGRRDPFKPLVQKNTPIIQKNTQRPEKIKGPLEKFELSQFRLIAILVVKGTPRAMVKAPDGKSYTVKVGEYIGMNDGIVKNIETKVIEVDDSGMRIEKSPDRVVVEEVGFDSLSGKETSEYRYIVM